MQQRDLISRRQEGTGGWLLQSDEFKSWFSGTRDTLFCPGIPGAGKTMLASIVIDHLQRVIQDKDTAVTYIFCNYKNKLEQTPFNFIASLLKQLFQGRNLSSAELKSTYNRHVGSHSYPSLDEVLDLLQSEISRYSRVFIVVDALDECNENDGTCQMLLSRLRILQTTSPVNILITSRFLPKIVQEFCDSMQLEIRASDEDMKRYLDAQMFRLSSCVRAKPGLQEIIRHDIINAANGMYVSKRLNIHFM
jgi:Cdc6-like AAA superfamily ATPase